LIAIQDALELEHAIFVGAFFYAEELAMLVRIRGMEVHAAEQSGHQELSVVQLGNQGAPNRLGVSFRGSISDSSVGNHSVPRSEVERLGKLAVYFHHRLQLARKIKPGDVSASRLLTASLTQSQTVSYFSPASFISDGPAMKILALDTAA
jgi:hypothetical protein